MSVRPVTTALSLTFSAVLCAAACDSGNDGFQDDPGTFLEDPTADAGDAGGCPYQCSLDGRNVIRSCTGEVVETCPDTQACGAAKCQDPCVAAAEDQSTNGCEFYFQTPPAYESSCHAAFVVNTSTQPVTLTFDRAGEPLDISKAVFRTTPGDPTLLPHSGPIPPGESVVLFVESADPTATSASNRVDCPAGAVPAAQGKFVTRTSLGAAFHLTTDAPVSAVAMYPFGGAKSHFPATTLLTPVVTWGTQHVVINPWQANVGRPHTQVIASEDGTEITLVPTAPLQDGDGVKGSAAHVPSIHRLDKGQVLQILQVDELTGSVLTSTKPTSVFGGHSCADVPTNGGGACDLLWQQIPSYEQWGSEYAAVAYRPRTASLSETMPYRIVAAHDGTRPDYDPAIPAGAPTELRAGEAVTFPASVSDAFVVRTQDAEHPIYMASYMTGYVGNYYGSANTGGAGDPEFVNVVPAGQWLNAYSFYADPTYEETSLVVVRARHYGKFEDVWLDCAGYLTGFTPLGSRGEYEYLRIDLSRGGGPGDVFGDKTCRTGLIRMKSDGPFTATLWGWGFAASYAYPGGMAHRKLVTTPLVPLR